MHASFGILNASVLLWHSLATPGVVWIIVKFWKIPKFY
jgi:hypothetical protein